MAIETSGCADGDRSEQVSLVSALLPTSSLFVLSEPNPRNNEPASPSPVTPQGSEPIIQNVALNPIPKPLLSKMKRLIESSAWDETSHHPQDSWEDSGHDDGSSASPYRSRSSPPLCVPAPRNALGRRSSSSLRTHHEPKVEAPLSVGSLKREYDLDTLRMYERRVKHAQASGRPLHPSSSPRLPAHPSSTASLQFPRLAVESNEFRGHFIVDEDYYVQYGRHVATNIVTPSFTSFPSAPTTHHGASQRTLVSESDVASMLEDPDHGWESDDQEDDDNNDHDGIFELDLE